MNNKSEKLGLEAALETTEIFLDLANDSEVWTEVPVVGLAFKLLRTRDTVREKLFAKKIHQFLFEVNKLSNSDRDKIRAKSIESPEELERIGNTLLLVIEKVTDLEKPKLLGQLFIAYIDDIISDETLRRLVHSVDIAFIDDLMALLGIKHVPHHLENLISSGLSRPIGGATLSNMGDIDYETTLLAHELCKAFFKINGTAKPDIRQLLV